MQVLWMTAGVSVESDSKTTMRADRNVRPTLTSGKAPPSPQALPGTERGAVVLHGVRV